MSNPYCERLGIEVPRLEEVAARKHLKPGEALIAALLERGGPMTVEALEARLESAGCPVRGIRTVRRASVDKDIFYRDRLGRLGLNLSSRLLDLKVFMIGLRPPRVAHEPEPQPAPAKPVTEPLTMDEVKAVLGESPPSAFTRRRIAAAILDAMDRPMTLEEIRAFLKARGCRISIDERTAEMWRGSLIERKEDGRLALRRESSEVAPVRKFFRERFQRSERWRLINERARRSLERCRAEDVKACEKAARFRRAIVCAFPEDGTPVAVTLLDEGRRVITTYHGETLPQVAEALAGFDLLAGIGIRGALDALELDADRWHLVDLSPPRKSYRLNRAGRTLRITTKLRAYVASGALKKLVRRLESDAKRLLAYYRYGILHNFIRLRWGFLDEIIHVEWAMEGDEHLPEILGRAKEEARPVELVLRWAPSWSDPWGRAQLYEVIHHDHWATVVKNGPLAFHLDLLEVQAARLVE